MVPHQKGVYYRTDMELGKYTLLKKLRPRSFDDEFPITFGAMGVEGGGVINKN